MERKARGHVKPTRSTSSNRWMHEHVTDPFVQQAKKLGYRSRAAFKIEEIDAKYKLLKAGITAVDLGASPGGWSQIAAPKIGRRGRVVAVDMVPMPGLPGVDFVEADFSTDEGLAAVVAALGESGKCDLVMSDMAPNMSGIVVSDQAKTMHLCELAHDFALRFLTKDGAFVVKTFQGSGFPEFLKALKGSFSSVATFKPKASRDRSAELYLVCRGLKSASGGMPASV